MRRRSVSITNAIACTCQPISLTLIAKKVVQSCALHRLVCQRLYWPSFLELQQLCCLTFLAVAMYICRARTTSGVCLTILAVLIILTPIHIACTRSLLQTFIPKGSDSCTSYVQSTCTLSTKAAPRADTCSQQNAKQLAADVSSADDDQAGIFAL